MRRLACLLLVVAISSGVPVRSSGAEIAKDDVKTAIEKGVDFLRKQQKPDGSWPDFSSVPSGVTSLCTLALLNSGVPPDDPAVVKALKYLTDQQPKMTYSISLRVMVFCAAQKNELLIRSDVAKLTAAQIRDGEGKGSWSYGQRNSTEQWVPQGDHSNAQFALLALHEAELAGFKVDPSVWNLAKKYWEDVQNPDGSWGYRPGGIGTGSMTCAGVASMVISAGHVSKGDAQVQGDRVVCCGDQQRVEPVEKGLEWLGRNFSVRLNPTNSGGIGLVDGGRNAWRMYYLYGLERVGRMTSRRFIGTHDWFREGAEALVQEQDRLGEGFWQSRETLGENDKNVSTSLALLFLAKGRRPVLIAKMKQGTAGDWNRHRSDLTNLTTYVETKWKMPLTWQVFDAERATVEDLQQSPVLFFSGSKKLSISDEQAARLRDYVDRGGFIFAEATCANCTEFDRSFQDLVKRMFPEPDYALRLLPPEHPVWHAEEKVPPNLLRPLYGVDYGCRTCLVYSPPPRPEDPVGNLSCYWELWQMERDQGKADEPKLSDKVRREIAAANSIGINVLAYATNREPKPKELFLTTVEDKTALDKGDRGKLYVANVRHPGGCDVASGAIPNLMRAAAKNLDLRVGVEPREVLLSDPALGNYSLLFMHGRTAFRLSDAEREKLKKFILEGDGMLFADAICASKPFANAFRNEMQTIFPDHPLKPIPVTDTLFSDKHGGFDLAKVKRREPQPAVANGPLQATLREGPPVLEGIKIGERYAVIFSPYDLSCALEKQQSLECNGYLHEDAERIGLNIIGYFLNEAAGNKGKK